MMTKNTEPLYNASAAAEDIGCSVATVTRWAQRLDIGQKVGVSIVLTRAEVDQIREAWCGKAGNPNWTIREN